MRLTRPHLFCFGIGTKAIQLLTLFIVLLTALVICCGADGREISDDRFYGQPTQSPHRLAAQITVHWDAVPLEVALDRLAESTGAAIWLDRRIDPNTPLSVTLWQQPISVALDRVAAAVGAAHVATNSMAYVGQADTAVGLRSLLAISHQQTDLMEPRLRKALLKRSRLDLKRLTQPRGVVTDLLASANVPALGLDSIPHDVWSGRQRIVVPLAEQLAILLHEFELTWVAADDGRRIRIVPLTRPVRVKRTHLQSAVTKLPTGTLAQDQVFPARSSGEVVVDARVEMHERIVGRATRVLVPRVRPPQQAAVEQQIFTLRVREKPVGVILNYFAQQTGLVIDRSKLSDAELGRLDNRVSFEVADAELDELLRAICEPIGLVATVEDKQVQLAPRADEAD